MADTGTQMDEDTQQSLQQLASAMSEASQAVVQDEEAAAKNLLKHLEAVGEEGGDSTNQNSLESILSFTGYGAAPSQQVGPGSLVMTATNDAYTQKCRERVCFSVFLPRTGGRKIEVDGLPCRSVAPRRSRLRKA